MRKLILLAVLFGGVNSILASPALSQFPRAANTARLEKPHDYYGSFSTPPVSPYVNLGVSSNGISNYQTLVRPMIDEREAIAQQSAAIDQLNQRMMPGTPRRAAEGRQPRPQSGARFMDYSRYFGTTW